MGTIPSVDYLDIHKQLINFCICGENIEDMSMRKEKEHVKRCIVVYVREIVQKNIEFLQNRLLEQAQIDMQNGMFD